MTTPKTVTFVGLGVMGFPMAGHLSRAGYTVRVYNRTRARADDWCATYDGTAFDTEWRGNASATHITLRSPMSPNRSMCRRATEMPRHDLTG